MRNFLFGCIVGAVGLYASMCFHIIRARDGYHFVPKSGLMFKDTYVDIRSFDVAAWRDHLPLAEALIQSDKRQLVQDSATVVVENTFDKLLNRQ